MPRDAPRAIHSRRTSLALEFLEKIPSMVAGGWLWSRHTPTDHPRAQLVGFHFPAGLADCRLMISLNGDGTLNPLLGVLRRSHTAGSAQDSDQNLHTHTKGK